METINDRLKIFFKSLNIRKVDFSNHLEYNQGNLNKVFNNEVGISPFLRKKILSSFPDLNENWLLTGEGTMLNNIKTVIVPTDDKENVIHNLPKYIPLLPISAQGGDLDLFEPSVYKVDCEKIITPVKDAEFAIRVSGHSMYPEYPSGSQVLVKKVNYKIYLDYGRVYVIDTTEGVLIKKLTKSDNEEAVKCVSINPDKNTYSDFDIPMTCIRGIYKVLMCMDLK